MVHPLESLLFGVLESARQAQCLTTSLVHAPGTAPWPRPSRAARPPAPPAARGSAPGSASCSPPRPHGLGSRRQEPPGKCTTRHDPSLIGADVNMGTKKPVKTESTSGMANLELIDVGLQLLLEPEGLSLSSSFRLQRRLHRVQSPLVVLPVSVQQEVGGL